MAEWSRLSRHTGWVPASRVWRINWVPDDARLRCAAAAHAAMCMRWCAGMAIREGILLVAIEWWGSMERCRGEVYAREMHVLSGRAFHVHAALMLQRFIQMKGTGPAPGQYTMSPTVGVVPPTTGCRKGGMTEGTVCFTHDFGGACSWSVGTTSDKATARILHGGYYYVYWLKQAPQWA